MVKMAPSGALFYCVIELDLQIIMRAIAVGWGFSLFATTQVDLGFFRESEFQGFKIRVLVRAVTKRLIGRTAATAPPVIPRFQLAGVGRLLRPNWFRHLSLLVVIIG